MKLRSLFVVSKRALRVLAVTPFQRLYINKLSKLLAKDTSCLVYLLTDHAGDTFISLSLLEALKTTVDSNFVVCIFKEYESLLKYFPKLADNYVTFADGKFLLFQSRDLVKFNGVILASVKFGTFGIKEKVRTRKLVLVGYKYAHLVKFWESPYKLRIDNYFRFILNVPEDFPLASPCISEEQRERAKQLFDSYNLVEGRTVILAPYSNSSKSYSDRSIHIFEKVASKLAEKGYIVCTNVDQRNPRPIRDTVAVSPSLDLLIPFADLAGYVITFRSGFADIVSGSRAKLFVLYPHFRYRVGVSFYDYCSISSIFKRSDTIELIGESEDFLKVLDYF